MSGSSCPPTQEIFTRKDFHFPRCLGINQLIIEDDNLSRVPGYFCNWGASEVIAICLRWFSVYRYKFLPSFRCKAVLCVQIKEIFPSIFIERDVGASLGGGSGHRAMILPL